MTDREDAFDAAALALVAHGELDEASYAALRARLVGYARRMLGSEALAEDAVAETLLSVFEAYRRGERQAPANAAAYLQMACRNKCIDELRRRRRRSKELTPDGQTPTVVVPPGSEILVEDFTMQRVFQALVERAAAAIPKVDHRASFLESVEEMRQLVVGEVETSDLLRAKGLEEGADVATHKRLRDAVQQRHARARKHLRDRIDEERSSGALSAMDADELVLYLNLLRRRQNDPSSDVEQ
ncbi:MAG: sigma factor [Polyangiales bacterium]